MKTSLLLIGAACLGLATVSAQQPDGNWIVIPTDTLDGWVKPATWWSCENNVIVADSDGKGKKPFVDYLMWGGTIEGDFEMELEYRILSDSSADAGICLRVESAEAKNGNLPCYQVELDTGPALKPKKAGKNFGNIHDGKRGRMVLRGLSTRFTTSGEVTETPLDTGFEPAAVYRDPPEWNACRIRVISNTIRVEINGQLALELIDDQDPDRSKANKIALQYRPNQKNRFEVRNLRHRKPTAVR